MTTNSLDIKEVRLRWRTDIYLREFHQTMTYDGLLEGVPFREMNAGIIESAKRTAADMFRLSDARVLAPEIQALDIEPHPVFDRVFEKLPEICTIALYRCLTPVHDKKMDYSEAAVIWFQDSFGLDLGDKNLENLLRLKWRNIAIDREY